MHLYPKRNASDDSVTIAVTCCVSAGLLCLFMAWSPLLAPALNFLQIFSISLSLIGVIGSAYIVGHLLLKTERLFGMPYGDSVAIPLSDCRLEIGTQILIGLGGLYLLLHAILTTIG